MKLILKWQSSTLNIGLKPHSKSKSDDTKKSMTTVLILQLVIAEVMFSAIISVCPTTTIISFIGFIFYLEKEINLARLRVMKSYLHACIFLVRFSAYSMTLSGVHYKSCCR